MGIGLIWVAMVMTVGPSPFCSNCVPTTQGMRARLLAARGEKERARATLKGAQQAEREAHAQLQQVLRENAALEAELARQTVGGFGGG